MAICKKKLEKDIENMIEEIYFNKNEIVEHDKKLLIINEENKELKKSMDDLSKKADNIDDKMKTLKDFNEIRSKGYYLINAQILFNLSYFFCLKFKYRNFKNWSNSSFKLNVSNQ